jgi:23S rRNA pseudouridine1911/1915/1917 synthase
MPFIVKKLFAEQEQKAFLYLIRELGYRQKEAQRLIAKGRLLCNGKVMSNTAGMVKGEFEFICFEPESRGLKPIFQTSDFALFDKPSGVMVHPQNRHTPYSMIDEIKHHFGDAANIVHRIDQETSGLLLASKNRESERMLKMMFEERRITKRYLAMVHGNVSRETKITVPLLRRKDESAIVRMVGKADEKGKPSETQITPLKYYQKQNMTLVEAKPLTGRQHQIRVHLFHIGHPIVGDPIYGQNERDVIRFLDKEIGPQERIRKSGAKRLLLHASQLEFELGDIYYFLKSKDEFIKEFFQSMK